MKTPWKRQEGAVLVVSLMVLVVLTLLAVSAINTSTVNLRIVGNMQAKGETDGATQEGIERLISNINNFYSPDDAPTNFNILLAGEPQDGTSINVQFDRFECVNRQPARGFSATWALTPVDTDWVIDAQVTDGAMGAQSTITQGLRVQMRAGSCPP